MMLDDHLPPTMQESHKPPFTLTEQTIRQAGLHVLTPQQQKKAVVVYDLSDDISVKQLSEFFGYCGGVEKIVLNQNQSGSLFSVVVLENEAAFATAVLLNHAILNDVSITVAPYTDFVKSSSGSTTSSSSSTNSNANNRNQQTYLEQLQAKKTAYEKVISLMSMGFVTSQDAVGTLQNKLDELDLQTQEVRQQFTTASQPVVQTTKMTLDATKEKIQPVFTATKEKLDPYTSTVNNFAKEQYEKVKQAEIWENDTVKQVTFVGKVAKDELANATKNAWNAVKTGWLSLKKDVETESSQLRGESETSSSPSESDRVNTPPVPQHLIDQRNSGRVDEYFAESNTSEIDQAASPLEREDNTTSHNHHHNNYSLGNEGDEYGVYSPQDYSTQPSTSNLLEGANDDDDEDEEDDEDDTLASKTDEGELIKL
jgi:hypothetical protein